MRRSRLTAAWILTAALLLLPGSSGGGTVFGLVDTGEIYASGDGGTSWVLQATVPFHDGVGIAAGVSATELFLVTRSGTVFRSMDAGSTWAAVGSVTASDVAEFTIDTTQALLVLTETGSVYRSVDAGVSFHGIAGIPASQFVSLARGPSDRLYALSRTGEVHESQDGGSSWDAVGSAPVSQAVSIRGRGVGLFLMTRTGEVFRSLDRGRTWLPVGGITASNMSAIEGGGPGLLAASETGEIYASTDGFGWTAIGAIQQLRVTALGADTPLATGVVPEDGFPGLAVRAPFPNPARLHEGSSFQFESSRAGLVRLELFDVQGRRVASLPAGIPASAGWNRVHWAPEGIAPGSYFLRIMSDSGDRAAVKWNLLR